MISGRQVVLREAESLQELAQHFPESFPNVVQILRDLPGKVICSGVGKSGHVAQKVASTLSSTGTPAFFMHPTEGLHGDLGALGPRDGLIAFSNSGESVEVLRFVQHSQVKCRVAVTASAHSSLAFCSDEVLLIPSVDEACPLGLAPTASTVMMLALGDALALTLCSLRPFSKEHYKRLHPAGALGHKLLYVEQVMRRPPLLLPACTSAATLLQAMVASGLGCVGLADEQGALSAVLSAQDVPALAALAASSLDRAVNAVCVHPFDDGAVAKQTAQLVGRRPGVIAPTATLLEASLMFQHQGHPCLWVQDPGCGQAAAHLLGILLPEDVMRVREGGA